MIFQKDAFLVIICKNIKGKLLSFILYNVLNIMKKNRGSYGGITI